MDELLDRTRVFYEWAQYYPRWAQAVFVATAVLVAFSTLVFFAGKKAAAALRETSEFERAVSWSVSVDKGLPPVENPSEAGIPDDRALRYTQASDPGDGATLVTPILPYLDRWNGGHEVTALNAGAKLFRWRYPTLDVLAANQAENPLIIRGIDLLVEESRPEDETALLVLSDYEDLMSVRVVSPIARELSDLRIGFDVADATTAGVVGVAAHPDGVPATQPLAHQHTVAAPSGNDRIPVDDALQAKGAVPILLRTNPKDVYTMFMAGKASEVGSLGPFTKGTAAIRGELTVRRGNATLGPFRFIADVALVTPGPQALLQPSGTYTVQLREYGSSYEVPVGGVHDIPPKGTDRVRLTLAAPRSSRHRLRVRLNFHDGRTLLSPPIELRLIKPE